MSKVLYGLGSAQLITSVSEKLETVQLKVLRQISKTDTTYVNRENIHVRVFGKTTSKMREETKANTRVPFVVHNNGKCNSFHKLIHNGRSEGRPTMSWAENSKEIVGLHTTKTEGLRHLAFNDRNEFIMNAIRR